jgi:hypothetical protein
VRFGIVDPMVASGCSGGVLVRHKEEATLAQLDRRACKAVVICRRGNRRRAAGRAAGYTEDLAWREPQE